MFGFRFHLKRSLPLMFMLVKSDLSCKLEMCSSGRQNKNPRIGMTAASWVLLSEWLSADGINPPESWDTCSPWALRKSP